MKQQKGFTLIELIVVIVILGILAATALPKFADMQKDARLASIQGALASVNSAKSIAHAQWLVNSANAATLEGVSVSYSASGYPDASSILALAGLVADPTTPTKSDHYTVTMSSTGATVQMPGATTPASCQFTYVIAASAAPVITAVASDVTKC